MESFFFFFFSHCRTARWPVRQIRASNPERGGKDFKTCLTLYDAVSHAMHVEVHTKESTVRVTKRNRWGDFIDEESLIRMATPLVAMLLRASVGVAGTRERWVWRPMSAGGCESWDVKCVVEGVSWAVFLRKNPCPGKRCPCARPDASHSAVLSSARWCVSWRRMMSYGSRDASKKRHFLGSAKPLTFRERQRNVDGRGEALIASRCTAQRRRGEKCLSAGWWWQWSPRHHHHHRGCNCNGVPTHIVRHAQRSPGPATQQKSRTRRHPRRSVPRTMGGLWPNTHQRLQCLPPSLSLLPITAPTDI